MKTRNFFNNLLAAIALSSACIFASCNKDNNDEGTNYTLSGTATGAQEVPAVNTAATATLNGSYNTRTNKFTYNISWNGLTDVVTDAHIHGPALVGVNAGVLHPLTVTTNGVTGIASGFVILSETNEDDLLSGKLYYNLHTVMNPTGEIRGQVFTSQ